MRLTLFTALISAALTVTPGIQNFWFAAIAWAATVCFAIHWAWSALRTPADVAVARPDRVEKIAGLLREAAEQQRNIGARRAKAKTAKDWEEAIDWSWQDIRIAEFLKRGFAYHVAKNFHEYRGAEREKLADAFAANIATAQYLEQLADRLAVADLDLGFVVPETFRQFDHEHWPTNSR